MSCLGNDAYKRSLAANQKQNKQGLKRMLFNKTDRIAHTTAFVTPVVLFNKTRQYTIHIFNKKFFFEVLDKTNQSYRNK